MGKRTAATIVACAGAGVLLTGAAGGAAYATTPQHATEHAVTAKNAADNGKAKNRRCHRPRRLVGRALHGEFTVRTKHGYRTVYLQRGKVTKTGDKSITITSRDSSAHTYTLTKNTRVRIDRHKSSAGKLANGDRAWVVTAPNKGTHTARVVRARTPGFHGPCQRGRSGRH